jgi:uncharacterized protein (DUF1778 family)
MPRNTRKTVAVHFRIEDPVAKRLERAAAADRRTLTDFCRVAALIRADEILGKDEETPQPPTKPK